MPPWDVEFCLIFGEIYSCSFDMVLDVVIFSFDVAPLLISSTSVEVFSLLVPVVADVAALPLEFEK